MELFEIATLSSKGQVTVPASIRDILNLRRGSPVMFKVTEKGVLFVPCEIKEKADYSAGEWKKIERLVAERGRVYKTAKKAREHLKSL